jgi:hypothetical protein
MAKKVCIYCGKAASTRDHVPPKSFLEKPYPDNLKTVPSCKDCNNGFSKDEEYFLILMSKISLAPSLTTRISEGGSISRALEQSPSLDDRLISSLESDDEGRILIRPETERIHRIIRKIALGLFVLRYGRIPSLQSLSEIAAYPYSVRDDRPPHQFILTFTEKFKAKPWKHPQKNIFSYIFVRDPWSSSKVWCIMDFHSTLWGVVHLPNPKSIKTRNDGQLWMFSAL